MSKLAGVLFIGGDRFNTVHPVLLAQQSSLVLANGFC